MLQENLEGGYSIIDFNDLLLNANNSSNVVIDEGLSNRIFEAATVKKPLMVKNLHIIGYNTQEDIDASFAAISLENVGTPENPIYYVHITTSIYELQCDILGSYVHIRKITGDRQDPLAGVVKIEIQQEFPTELNNNIELDPETTMLIMQSVGNPIAPAPYWVPKYTVLRTMSNKRRSINLCSVGLSPEDLPIITGIDELGRYRISLQVNTSGSIMTFFPWK